MGVKNTDLSPDKSSHYPRKIGAYSFAPAFNITSITEQDIANTRSIPNLKVKYWPAVQKSRNFNTIKNLYVELVYIEHRGFFPECWIIKEQIMATMGDDNLIREIVRPPPHFSSEMLESRHGNGCTLI